MSGWVLKLALKAVTWSADRVVRSTKNQLDDRIMGQIDKVSKVVQRVL